MTAPHAQGQKQSSFDAKSPLALVRALPPRGSLPRHGRAWLRSPTRMGTRRGWRKPGVARNRPVNMGEKLEPDHWYSLGGGVDQPVYVRPKAFGKRCMSDH